MLEGAGGVKRGQTELEKNLHHDELRKREGIKRELRDIPRVQYEEYEASWDQEILAKKCKGSINCILYRCGCMERSTENLVGSVRISPLTPAMRDQQAMRDRSPFSAVRMCQYGSGLEQSYLSS